MNRRVMILTQVYPPSPAIGAFRPARFVKYLPEYGWQPFVITSEDDMLVAAPDASRLKWVDEDVLVDRSFPWRIPNALAKTWREPLASPTPQNTSPANANKVQKQASFRIRAKRFALAAMLPFRFPDKHIWWAVPAFRAMQRIVREYQPDVLFSTSPPHSIHLIALALKKWANIPLVLDFRDPWARTEWSEAHDRIRPGADRFCERFCVRRADQVILNTPELLAEFKNHYPAAWHAKFSAIPNGYDPQVRQQVEALVAATPKRPEGAPLRLCHAGSVYGRRDIRPIIEAVAQLNLRGFRCEFEQVGTVVNHGEVAACVAKNQASELVHLSGQQSHEEALRRMAAADVLIIVRQNTALQTPAKLYELMLFGKPILVLDGEGAMTRIVRQYDLGTIADPVDPVAIASAIQAISTRNHIASSEGRSAALRQYDARLQTAELAKVLEAAVESRPRRNTSGD